YPVDGLSEPRHHHDTADQRRNPDRPGHFAARPLGLHLRHGHVLGHDHNSLKGPLRMTTHIFRIEGMHCGSCALLIDDTLEDLPGVASTQTSMKKRLSTVDLDATVTTPDDV